ncbi:Mth938-like domain-containing protein [Sneathiella glossodoripedis]|uniref:Mth938-like domain-containing protein n=1 Tax=Sneathiella glossodoripedis TaxID=418853 RepID=UPI0004716561|nr:Mth938-like domain-containing protein [Sneathiella glossodoripedis]
MQDISGTPEEGQQLVNSYGDGGFRVSGVRYEGNIIILPDQTLNWSLERIDELTVESLQPVLDAEPAVEILLIGCGGMMAFIEEEVRAKLRSKGITIDSMDSGAAVRTYNVLLLEKRRVAAALIAS